ncbi:MAG: peptidase U32 family protein [Mycoplasmatales bacterium]
MEILTPVKDLKSAKAAIHFGADAIYLGAPSFGARMNATITIEETVEIVKLANSFQVATFFTFNNVVFNDELASYFSEINQVYLAGATGIIVQDMALGAIIAQFFPDLEVHASTQMNIMNSFGCKMLSANNFSRVVVPREMSFERISKLRLQTELAIECFIHGALCVSYSGQCFDSTLLNTNSANRGRCSQYCRMPQRIVNTRTNRVVSTGQYPLNLKDLSNIANVDKYIEAGVDSFKIEGRLKQFDYTAVTTSTLASALGRRHAQNDLTDVYNRSFTNGRFFNQNGLDLVNLNRPNNNGHFLGTVSKIEKNNDKKLGFYKFLITITTNETLSLQDNIRFVAEGYEDGQNIDQLKGNQVLSNCSVPIGAQVFRTQKASLLANVHRELEDNFKKQIINVKLSITTRSVFFFIDNHKFESAISFEKAQKMPITIEKIKAQLAKTNDSYFSINLIQLDYDEDLFTQIKNLNTLKREIISAYEKIIFKERFETNYQQLIQSNVLVDQSTKCLTAPETVNYFIEVNTLEQYNFVKENYDYPIFVSNYRLAKDIAAEDYLVLPRVIYDDEVTEIEKFVQTHENLVVSEYSMIEKYHSRNLISNFSLNTTNHLSQSFLKTQGVGKQIISIELNEKKLLKFINIHSIINIYGRVPVMLMDYCPINMQKAETCGSCTRCHNGDYQLEDNFDRKFPLLYEGNYRIGMYSERPINLIAEHFSLKAKHFSNFHLRFTDETTQQIKAIIESLINPKKIERKLENNYIKGSFYKEIL